MAGSAISFTGSIAKMYDEILGPAYFDPYAIETAKRAAAFKPKNVLETACGTGIVTNQLCKHLPVGVSITATDISSDMLEIGKAKLASAKNLSWQVADVVNLPFPDSSFDLVVCQFGVMFFSDKKKAFSEMHRVLRKGGKFIFSTWDKLDNNPVAGAGRRIIMDFFDGNPPANIRTAFSMDDKKEILTLTEEANFTCLNYEVVPLPCIAPSAELLATAQVDGSIISNLIREKDPNAAPVLRSKIAKAITEKFGDQPVKGMMQAIVVTAERK